MLIILLNSQQFFKFGVNSGYLAQEKLRLKEFLIIDLIIK